MNAGSVICEWETDLHKGTYISRDALREPALWLREEEHLRWTWVFLPNQ